MPTFNNQKASLDPMPSKQHMLLFSVEDQTGVIASEHDHWNQSDKRDVGRLVARAHLTRIQTISKVTAKDSGR